HRRRLQGHGLGLPLRARQRAQQGVPSRPLRRHHRSHGVTPGSPTARADFPGGRPTGDAGGVSEKKSRFEQALDLFLYAPMGLALTAREELPRLVEKGRKQFSDQATTARMMGEYALQEGRRDLEERAKKVTDTLGGLTGTRRPPSRPAPAQA